METRTQCPKHRLLLPALVLMLTGGIAPVIASSISASASILDEDLGFTCTQNSASATPAFCNGEWTYGDEATTTFGGQAYAAAAFGILHSASSAVASCNLPPGDNCYGLAGDAESSASFEDTFNITGGPSAGYLDLLVVTEGTGAVTCVGDYATAICGGGASFGIAGLSGGNPIFFNGVDEQGTGLSVGTNDINVWIPFNAVGGMAQVTNGLTLTTQVQCWVAANTTCSAYANFSDTAYVAGLSVLDSNLNPVAGAMVTTESGTDYNNIPPPSAVPEPSTLMLTSIGVLALSMARRRRRAS